MRRPLHTTVTVRRRLASALLSAMALLTAIAAPEARAEYNLGEGLSLFDGRVVLGGYAAINFSALDHSRDRLVIDDLSTFLTVNLSDRWSLFSEAEVEDPLHLGSDGFGAGDDVFRVERLYAQWQGDDLFRLRIGKMLTPIGLWNVIHAAPLVWSTSRPVTTEHFFDTGLTGAEATLTTSPGDYEVATTLFVQVTEHLDDPGEEQEFRRAFGGRVQAERPPGIRAGVSFVRFDDDSDHRWENTVAADVLWATRIVELSAEAALNVADSGATTGGAYVQAVAHCTPLIHPFLRLETVDLGSRQRTPVVLGVAFKPSPPLVFKIEGILGGDDTSLGGEGLLTSFSVLF